MKIYPLCVLCAVLGVTEARSATLDYAEVVHYNFKFEVASGGISLFCGTCDPTYPFDLQYSISEYAGDGSYQQEFSFGFYHYGRKAFNFEGLTMNLAALQASPPLDLQGVFFDPEGFGSPVIGGSVTFGEANSITDWNFIISESFWGLSSSHQSDPLYWSEVPPPYDLVIGSDAFTGRSTYGYFYSEPDNFFYTTQPGRWTTSIQTVCYTADEGGSTPSGGVSEKCEPVTPVPLPPSALLLASALAGLGALRQLRRPVA